jgi:hypothetical protein
MRRQRFIRFLLEKAGQKENDLGAPGRAEFVEPLVHLFEQPQRARIGQSPILRHQPQSVLHVAANQRVGIP